MKIPNFSGLRPSPSFKDSTYTVIDYLPTLWVLLPVRVSRGKISGGSRKYRKGVDHRKGGSARKGGVAKWCRAMLAGLDLEKINKYVVFLRGKFDF